MEDNTAGRCVRVVLCILSVSVLDTQASAIVR